MRIDYKLRGFDELRRRRNWSHDPLESAANDTAEDAGLDKGYLPVTSEGLTRSRAAVVTSTAQAIRDNSENNTLIKALGSNSA